MIVELRTTTEKNNFSKNKDNIINNIIIKENMSSKIYSSEFFYKISRNYANC